MAKILQHLVSKQKKRLNVDGFDLDLSYITEQAHAESSAALLTVAAATPISAQEPRHAVCLQQWFDLPTLIHHHSPFTVCDSRKACAHPLQRRSLSVVYGHCI